MSQTKSPSSQDSPRQSIEELGRRFEQLNKRKIQAETNLQNARTQLDKLQQEAREKYQTDDVNELRLKLQAMQAENEERRRSYQVRLDEIEKELAAVEDNFVAAEAESAGGKEPA